MFKTKTRRIIFLCLLVVSLALNAALFVAAKGLANRRDEIKDCASRALKATENGTYIGPTARQEAIDHFYDLCLKSNYGIDQKLQ